ncbi:polysaccharide biosynthesis/export family protein [Spirulina sp. CCNP1310]|uniref:polysaccharide biosynthesis/export family protein n=1 Tax=Spirulina sp. CCNP1310 TaxID=3110249 RepID=UPI002B1FAA5C|nr:polysaccharide biosynthesis/export family protein [Spirulina sp. CCNP1310]MEA5421237.1 polysaccharide biosynthesis/export family protein [Spirulina sp. CCNP1310]
MSSLPHRCTAALVASLFTTATGSLYLAFPSWAEDADELPKFQFESSDPVFFELPPPQVEEEPFTEIRIEPAQPLPPPTVAPEPAQPLPPPTFDPENPPPTGYNPPPYQDSLNNEFNRYRLGIGDVITINVVGFPEFNTQAILDLEGQVLIPILGLVRLRGMTLPEAETLISYELGDRYLRNRPDVIVNLSGPRTALVTVTGEVVEPGFYELPPGSSPFDALFRAGGSTQQGDLRSVLVRRTLLDGTVIEQTLDLLTPLQGGQPLPPMFLLEGDAVILSRLALGEDQNYDRRLASRSNLAQARITVRVLNHPGQGLGALELANGSTFLDALTQISPNPTDANLSAVALMRFDPEQGRPVTQMLNVRQALMGDLSQDVPLEDEDVIVIGRSLIARISYTLNLFTRPFRDILGFLLFFREISDSADTLFSP